MRDYTDEAYIHARLYAMRSRLLSFKDYASMVGNQDPDPYDKTSGAHALAEAEEALFREQISGVMALAEAIAVYTPLFISFLRQFEILNAKLILTNAFGIQAPVQWYDIGPYAVLKRGLLKEDISVQVLRTIFAGTYLSDLLEGESSYENMEARADLCAVKDLYGASLLLGPDNKSDFQNLMGRRTAVTLTALSLRLRNIYQWDEERRSACLRLFYDAFEGNLLPHVNVVEGILERHVEQVRAGSGQEPSVVDLEHHLEQQYYTWISTMFHRDFNSICCVVAYLWLLFYQIRNLFKILEGRRFGYPPEGILARIICNR